MTAKEIFDTFNIVRIGNCFIATGIQLELISCNSTLYRGYDLNPNKVYILYCGMPIECKSFYKAYTFIGLLFFNSRKPKATVTHYTEVRDVERSND